MANKRVDNAWSDDGTECAWLRIGSDVSILLDLKLAPHVCGWHWVWNRQFRHAVSTSEGERCLLHRKLAQAHFQPRLISNVFMADPFDLRISRMTIKLKNVTMDGSPVVNTRLDPSNNPVTLNNLSSLEVVADADIDKVFEKLKKL